MNKATTSTKTAKNITAFFVLTYALSLPIYIVGALLPQEMAPMVIPLIGFIPVIVALILTYRENGTKGAKILLKRSFDFKNITRKIWYVPTIFLMPIVYIIVLWILGLIGVTLSDSPFPLSAAPILFIIFFILALTEEVGWMGYAFDPMEERSKAFKASLILGIIHAAWHIPVFLFVTKQSLLWVTGQVLVLIGLRILQVWIYNNTGKSLFAAILFHAAYNVPTMALPVYGSPLGPVISAIFVIIIVIIVLIFWDSETMTNFRKTKSMSS